MGWGYWELGGWVRRGRVGVGCIFVRLEGDGLGWDVEC